MGLDIIKLYFAIPGKIFAPFRIISNLKSLIFHKLFYFLVFTPSIKAKSIISILYYFVFIISFCSLLWWNKKTIQKLFMSIITLMRFKIIKQDISKEFFFLFYFIMFAFIYSIFNYSWITDDGYRYLVPLFPLIVFIISLFLDRIKKSQPLIFLIILCFLILAGFIGNLKLIGFDGSFGMGFDISGIQH